MAEHKPNENNGSATPQSPAEGGTLTESESYQIADPETSLGQIYAADAEAQTPDPDPDPDPTEADLKYDI